MRQGIIAFELPPALAGGRKSLDIRFEIID
jgi:hypothetical protein